MIIKQVRLSQQAKDQLSRLKGKTGIKNWNILCRWALLYSLAEKNVPADLPLAADSNLEMSWYTFGGEYYEIYEALIKAWCMRMEIEAYDETGLAYSVNGAAEFSLPSTLNLSFHGISAEALMIAARGGCAISSGSACTSKSYAPSYVLAAMGVPEEQIESSIRLSWGAETDRALFKTEFAKLLTAAKALVQ